MEQRQYDFLAHGHGKTAPWVDLVNSEEWDAFGCLTDHLNSPAWAPYFLRHWHFAKPSREPAPIATAGKRCVAALAKKLQKLFLQGKPIPSSQNSAD